MKFLNESLNLGLTIVSRLSFKTHVNYICNKVATCQKCYIYYSDIILKGH